MYNISRLSRIIVGRFFLALFYIAIMYVAAIVCVITMHSDFSHHFWLKAVTGGFSERRIAFYSVPDRIGEAVLYERLKQVADKEGYDYVGIMVHEYIADVALGRHVYNVAASLCNYILKPQFNLALTHHVKVVPYGYNVAYLNMPRNTLYHVCGVFKKKWSRLCHYDAYADIYSLVHGKNDILQKIANDKLIIKTYIAHGAASYEPTIADKALITGSLWGGGRSSDKTKAVLKRLADDGMLLGVGLSDHLGFLQEKYLGKMEHFGKPATVIGDKLREYGISLIFHNQSHRLEGIPTSRISEAVANGVLAISDDHYFIRKVFGDSILYVDVGAGEDEMYDQVKQHIEWARANPELVRQKTKKAHEIWSKDFTMEKQLENIFVAVEVFHKGKTL